VIDQGMHRFLGDGVHYRDLLDIRAAIGDWSQWCTVWSKFAEATEARGMQALDHKLSRTAAREFVRATLYFHYAQKLFYDDPLLKRATHDRKVAVFGRAASLLDPPHCARSRSRSTASRCRAIGGCRRAASGRRA
jgi:2,6-dihydroxypseudooxynicotine hydrolase